MWPFENSLKNQLRNQDIMKKYREWLKRWLFKGNRLNILLVIGLGLSLTLLSAYGIYNWQVSKLVNQQAAVGTLTDKQEQNTAVPGQSGLDQDPAMSQTPTQAQEASVEVDPETMAMPVMGHVLTNVGMSYSEVYEDFRYNTGVALASKPGSEIKVALPGTVSLVSTTDNGTLQVSVNHGKGWESSYSGLEKVNVKAGQTLEKNQVIGVLGNHIKVNGVAENHLYFKMIKDGEPIDPNNYWK